MFDNREDILSYLTITGHKSDGEIDIITTSMALSKLDKDSVGFEKYDKIINDLEYSLNLTYEALRKALHGDLLTLQAQALKNTLYDEFGLRGDVLDYDNLDNINMFSVIDRKQGIPISLCILAIGLARRVGWHAEGINFPGHFMMRLDHDGARSILDPFQGFRDIQAKDMRQILLKTGYDGELSASFYEPCTNREIILRYQNNLKYRLIDAELYDEAMHIVERMHLFAPEDHRLHLDKAVLFARLDQTKAAIESITFYLDKITDLYDRAEALAFLLEMRNRLN
jgi:regulator of sirC expression with transglutaminase-like and TPR domain